MSTYITDINEGKINQLKITYAQRYITQYGKFRRDFLVKLEV